MNMLMNTHTEIGNGSGFRVDHIDLTAQPGYREAMLKKGLSFLEEGRRHWLALSSFRTERIRNKNYTFGRQWNDMITVNGCRMTEHDYIISEGNIPLKNNLIRRIVRNVLGVFRLRLSEKMETWDKTLQSIAARNSLYELYSRTMEEFLISGMAVHRIGCGVRNGCRGVTCRQVSPDSFFFDTASRDIRGDDLSLVGQFHEIGFTEYCDSFIRTRSGYEKAAYLWNGKSGIRIMELWRREMVPRRLVHDRTRGVVIKVDEQVWQKSRRLRGMPSKWFLDDVWRYYFIGMDGTILREGDSPYPHGSHPYEFKCYPFLDGETHSFVADIIDQQRYTNRLITMYDWIMRASAKGVLLMPEGAVDPENMQDVADQWSRFNGVIVYRPKAGQPDPRQVSGNATNIGIGELLDIQLKMLEDVSGVNGALQGNLSGSSISGTLYNQQTRNALTSLSDILDTFASFISSSNEKQLSLSPLFP